MSCTTPGGSSVDLIVVKVKLGSVITAKVFTVTLYVCQCVSVSQLVTRHTSPSYT